MSGYKLADGTYSDQYKVGDKFVVQDSVIFRKGTVVIYHHNDGSDCPWFIKAAEFPSTRSESSCMWYRLSAYKEDVVNPEDADLVIEELEAKIENLEEYISELVKENEQQKKVLDNFAQLTDLVSAHSHLAEALNAEIGDDVVERLVHFLKYDLNSLKQQADTYVEVHNQLASHRSFDDSHNTCCQDLLETIKTLQTVYDNMADYF